MTNHTIQLNAALAIFEDQLPDIRKACVLNAIDAQQLPHKELDSDGDWSKNDIRLHLNYLVVQKKVKPLQQVIKRIDGRNKHTRPGNITDADIDRARDYPIAELFEQLTGQQPRHGMVSCPFHDDTNPSMSLRRHNRYKCFSCGAKGDVIDLQMKLGEMGFIDAVKKLI